MALKLFDHISAVTDKKIPWSEYSEEDKKTWNTFIINRTLSMSEELVEVINEIQVATGGTLEPRELHKVYFELFAKRKIWSKYIKKREDAIDDFVYECIAKWFSCSTANAKDYLPILAKDGIDELQRILGAFLPDETKLKKYIKQIKKCYD